MGAGKNMENMFLKFFVARCFLKNMFFVIYGFSQVFLTF